MNSTLIQATALVVMIVCATAGGMMLPTLLERSESAGLRYTDVSVEGAPPFVALGTAIGALRGLIVDFLWIKVNYMKRKGLFYEVMADADLITKLQPRFAAVWAFHGHNMAYNISVATHTREERWEWVNAGIRLVRNQGLRYNPNDLVLHKELAFWFAHKIEGVADDAHLFYKREFCKEWHFILGPPPESHADRIAWMKAIADAPDTLGEAEREVPGVAALVARLDASLTPFGDTQKFAPTSDFLRTHGMWEAVREQSEAARILGVEQQMRSESPFFNAFDEIAADPEMAEAWDTLIRFVRKRVLLDEYNMNPQYMYEFTRDLGPIDWRHGQAHALYWSRRGSILGEARVADQESIYKMLNNDRIQMQAMQGLARYGRITFDPFSSDIPSRFPDPRWINVIDEEFNRVYAKHYDTRGAGGETFIAFLKNFMSSAIREAFRSGERDRAQAMLDSLDQTFRLDATTGAKSLEFSLPLEAFVREQVKGEYETQPHIAPSEAVAALRYGFREGVGRNRPDVYRDAIAFVNQVIEFFRGNSWNDYVNKFGEARMGALMQDLATTRQRAFVQLMTDPTVGIAEKATIWAQIDKFEPQLRVEVYDLVSATLGQQFARHEASRVATFGEVFPEPAGLELFRAQIAQQRIRLQEQEEARKDRDVIEKK